MIIQAELKCKQTGCEADTCAVDKVIELPSPRFRQFSRALLADYDFIAENKDAIRHDDDARHCLLILDAEGTDGFLIDPQGYNYARYSAFVPNARSLLTPDMGIDRSYLSPAEPWRNENRDEILRMTLRVDGKPDYTLVLPADEEYLDAVKAYLDIDVFADAKLCDIRFKVPYIGELIRDTDCPAVEDYNDFAEALEDIWQKDGMLLTYFADSNCRGEPLYVLRAQGIWRRIRPVVQTGHRPVSHGFLAGHHPCGRADGVQRPRPAGLGTHALCRGNSPYCRGLWAGHHHEGQSYLGGLHSSERRQYCPDGGGQMRCITMGSLFDGIGGFPLAAIHNGVIPLWASEIEPFPIRVTQQRLPGMLHYGDITKLDGAMLPPVDIICGGSPCQDLSVAGARAGLAGERSGLFTEQTRIVKEMRDADRSRGRAGIHIRPRFMVWENVPGAFSSGERKGEDFRIVLEEIVRIKCGTVSIPGPYPWAWQPAGRILLGTDFSLCWRCLDAQYWGVPQRRKRIFLIADFAGRTADKVLFDAEGLFGDTAPGV